MTQPYVVTDLVAYAHVADVHRSGEARLMVAQAEAEIDPAAQAVLFYLFTPDIAALREQLLADGVPVGEIERPAYMPNGVARVEDPDGYALLLAQQ